MAPIELGLAPWIVALLGVIALVYGIQAYRRKKMPIFDTDGRQRETIMWVGLIAGGLLLFGAGGWDYINGQIALMQTGGGATPAVPQTPGTPAECSSVTAPSITLRGAVDGAPATAVVAGTDFAYRKVGATSWSPGHYGTALTVFAPGDQVEFELGNQTTTPVTGNYYTRKMMYTVPCAQTVALTGDLALEAAVANIAMFYLNDQGTANAATTIGAGQTKTLYVSVTGEYQHSFGDKDCGDNSNVALFYYNSSELQTLRYGSYAEVACPGSAPPVTGSGTHGNVTKCFNVPVLTSDQTTGNIPLTIQAQAAVNPANGIRMIWYDSNRYQNTVTGEFVCGAANNANADVGQTSLVAPALSIGIA